jgi:phosphoglycerate dehydrogenase-like enzyme
MIRILVACPLNAEALENLNGIPEFEISERPGLTPEQLLDEIRGADALVCGGSPVAGGPALGAADGLKLIVDIGEPGGVDLEAAQRRRIEVRRVTEDRTIAVLKDFFNV